MSDWLSKAGAVTMRTPKYEWTQTIDDVHVSIPLPAGTKGKDVLLESTGSSLRVSLKSTKEVLVDGPLFATVKAKDLVWTLEDGKIELILPKVIPHEAWKALVRGECVADPLTAQEMEKKMMLEKFQNEHAGFDFSGAEMTGQVPADPKSFGRFD